MPDWKFAMVFVALCCWPAPAVAQEPATAGHAFPKPGEWVCFRGNQTLDARSRLKGHLTQPGIVWKHFVGSMETTLVVSPAGADAELTVPPEDPGRQAARIEDARWGLSQPVAEIQGRVQAVPRGTQVTYADALPDVPGLERIEFESGFSKPTVNGQWQSCVGRCFAWRNGKRAEMWQTESIDGLFQALPVAGDFDADGQLEVALLPWYELLILEARSGRIESRCRFTKGRSYGFFGVYDMESDGTSEFLVMADFAKHIEVLGYRDGKLQLLWQREIELDIANPQKILRVHPDPAADVDGDGKLEVVANLYNDTGDGRWHVVVHDGITGAVETDLPDEHMQGIADVDGDGVSELLTTRTNGRGVPKYGPITVRSLKGARPATLWEHADAGWAIRDRPMPLHVNNAATLGHRDALHRQVDGRVTVVLRQAVAENPDQTRLAVASWEDDGFVTRTIVAGRRLEPRALDAGGALLARCTTAPTGKTDIRVMGGRVEVVGTERTGVPGSTAVVAVAPGEARPTVVVQGSGEELVAFLPPRRGQACVERWRRPGRGQADGWPSAIGPVIGDLSGGERHLVYATSATTGCARLVATQLSGRELWHHDFPAIPGTPPVWNTGGIIYWQTGHFSNRQSQDVLVTVRRSMMHSEETCLLSGRDGHEVWRRPRQISNRGVGGTPFAIADYDGDGLDDVASLHPSILYLLSGATGEDLLAKDATWEQVPAKPVYWGLPIAGDFEGTGKPSLFFATTRRSMTGVIRADGSLMWWDALDRSTTCYPALGDFDGDGHLEAIGLGYDDGLRCYDTATGDVEWRLPTPASGTPAGTASGDVDSDGRDEALVALGTKLYCLGADAGKGVVEWTVELPTSLGPPVIADVDGNGKASVLLVGRDGYLYCVR